MPLVGDQIQFDGSFLDQTGAPISGLTDVVITVYNHAGTAIATAAACAEIGSTGIYRYSLSGASVTGVGEYVGKMSTSTTTVPYRTIVLSDSVFSSSTVTAAAIADAVWDETMSDHLTTGSTGAKLNAAGASGDPFSVAVPGSYATGTAGAALGAIGNAITIQTIANGPILAANDLRIISGHDYSATDNRSLDFTPDLGDSQWPDLTGATIQMKIRKRGSHSVVATWTGSVVNASTNKRVRAVPTAAQTGVLTAGTTYEYLVQATLTSTRICGLAEGFLVVG